MASMQRCAVVALVWAALGGCNALLGREIDPEFCAAHPDDSRCPVSRCTASSECADLLVCDVPSGQCVECTQDEPGACKDDRPVCGVDNTCRGCTDHSECGSEVCGPEGTCIDASMVAFVAAQGTGTTAAGCSRDAACPTLADAVATPKPYIKIAAGTVADDQTTEIQRVVTILADPGAKLDRTGDGVILEVRGNSADVQIYDLEIIGASGGAVGVSIPSGGTPKLALIRVKVTRNDGGGISIDGGNLTVSRCTISDNQGRGGISMASNGVVVIASSFIHHNRNDNSNAAGGLVLRPTGSSRVEFNTIVDNTSLLGATSAGGISCDEPGFVADNNLVFRNIGGVSGQAQTVGACTYGRSFVMPGATPGDESLRFVRSNELPYDYHLTAASPASVVGAAGQCTGEDVDGDARPIDGACDLGADELKR